MNVSNEMSPCACCLRVKDPGSCDNKNCIPWRNWFLARWALLHAYPRRVMERPAAPAGVAVGGCFYAAPHQIRQYLAADPCHSCSCGADLCPTPCRARQHWAKANGEVKQ